jgi:quinol monooxygenase YgiN
MSEYSGCDDFTTLREAYKKSDKLDKFLKTPEMKKLHKQAMKLQGAEKLIKKVKEQGEA